MREDTIVLIADGDRLFARTAATALRRKGYQVHVYDRYDRIGGLLVYGIPNFKLEKEVVARRADLLRRSGVTFHLDFEVGRDATLAELRQRHAAVLIATGVYKAREIKAPGIGLPGMAAVICFALIIGSKYLVGLANWVEVALFAVRSEEHTSELQSH